MLRIIEIVVGLGLMYIGWVVIRSNWDNTKEVWCKIKEEWKNNDNR